MMWGTRPCERRQGPCLCFGEIVVIVAQIMGDRAMTLRAVRVLFVIAGLYDFIIGLTFLFFGSELFDSAGVPQPKHWAYIQFGSLMLMVFGTMFLTIAVNPHQNRNLIPFGMLLKLSYTSLCGYYWMTTDCPTLFKPFAVIDGAMLVLFYVAYRKLPSLA